MHYFIYRLKSFSLSLLQYTLHLKEIEAEGTFIYAEV